MSYGRNGKDCEILVSAMNQASKKAIVDRLGVASGDKCLIINQVTGGGPLPRKENKGNQRFLSYREKGLSKSRNRALTNAEGDVCCICDDDCCYVENYKEIIADAYDRYKDADIISFDFIRADKTRKTMRGGKVGFVGAMKMTSAQITLKKTSIDKIGLAFDERFGTGSGKYNWGEENIFLFDGLRAGLKIYHVPRVVVVKQDLGTTWDKSSTSEHYVQQGAIYYRMSARFWRIFALQYVLRKRKLYGEAMSGLDVYRSMVKGAKMYRREYRNG